MSHPVNYPQEPPRDDALLNRYREANAHDPLRPHPALRETVLTHAKNHQSTLETSPRLPIAANDSQWTIRALGSVAVMGLVGLLVMQFERGTPDEKAAALGTPAAQERRAEAVAPHAASPAPEPAPKPAFAASGPVAAESAAPTANRQAAPPAKGLAPKPSGKVAKAEAAPKSREAEAVPASAAVHPPAANHAAPAAEPIAAPAPVPMAPEADRLAAAPLADTAAVEPHKARSAAATSPPTQRPAASMATPHTQPPLHAAAEQGDLEALKNLLTKGFDIDARNAQGQTALMLAAGGHNKALLMALLTAGADKTPTDRSGLTAAAYAERANHRDWLPLLQP